MSLRPTPTNRVIKVLSKIGFKVARQRGSHLILKHPDGRLTVVSIHAGEDIGRGLLLKIIKDVKMSKEQFLKLLEDT